MSFRSVLSALSRTSASSSRLSSGPSRAASSVAASAAPSTPAPTQYLDFPALRPLKPTHGVHVATLHLRSHHALPLTTFTTFAVHAARALSIPTSLPAALPTTRELYTVLKSPFVHKKAQENFERRTHRRVVKVYDAEREAVDLWLRYLKKNGLGGVGAKAIVYEWVDYGFGRSEIERLEGMMQGGEVEKAAEGLIKALGGDEFQPKDEAQPAVEAKSADAVDGEVSKAEGSEGKGEVKGEAEGEAKGEAAIEPKIQPAGVETA
ncbi:mitochondrial 37S ribosomal protein rsm10 [Cryptotrichosporon argae]